MASQRIPAQGVAAQGAAALARGVAAPDAAALVQGAADDAA